MQADKEFRGYKIIGHSEGGLPIYQAISQKGGKWMKSLPAGLVVKGRPIAGESSNE